MYIPQALVRPRVTLNKWIYPEGSCSPTRALNSHSAYVRMLLPRNSSQMREGGLIREHFVGEATLTPPSREGRRWGGTNTPTQVLSL